MELQAAEVTDPRGKRTGRAKTAGRSACLGPDGDAQACRGKRLCRNDSLKKGSTSDRISLKLRDQGREAQRPWTRRGTRSRCHVC